MPPRAPKLSGLCCPFCNSVRLRTIDTRSKAGTQRRRRECKGCGERFSTIEVVVPDKEDWRLKQMLQLARQAQQEMFKKGGAP